MSRAESPPAGQSRFESGQDRNHRHIRPISPTPSAIADTSSSNGRRSAAKNAGFKPIGQASSAIKRFFPDEEDEGDQRALTPAPTNSPPTYSQRSSAYDHGDGRSWSRADRPSYIENVPNNAEFDERPHHNTSNEPRPNPVKTQYYRQASLERSPPRRATVQEGAHRPPDVTEARPDFTSMATTPNIQSLDRGGHVSTIPVTPPSEESHGELYAIISQVGEGTFGKVYKARNTVTRVHVALKRIRMESERDGFPVTAMREIKLLQSLQHENIVRLYEMMVSNGIFFFRLIKFLLLI